MDLQGSGFRGWSKGPRSYVVLFGGVYATSGTKLVILIYTLPISNT